MTATLAVEPIRRAVIVPVPVEQAFALFANELARWWPLEYTWSGEVLEAIGIEPYTEGRCFEIGPHRFHCDWGRVLAWKPPHHLAFTWQIDFQRAPQPNPALASEVEVRFIPEGPSTTRVELEHRHLGRHSGGADYRAALDAPQGWTYMLGRYVAAAGEDGGAA